MPAGGNGREDAFLPRRNPPARSKRRSEGRVRGYRTVAVPPERYEKVDPAPATAAVSANRASSR